MPNYQYVGRAGRFLGKSIPQICLRLKDFGIGRMFVRETYKRYPEVTYYILTKMEADMSDQYMRLGNFEAQVVFRGGHYGTKPIPGFKEDFQLVPKDQEKYYLEKTLPQGQKWREPTVVPKFVEMPPLLKEMLLQECIDKQIKFKPDEIKLPLVVDTSKHFSHAKYEE